MIPEMDSQSEAWGAHSPLPWRIDSGGDIIDANERWVKIVNSDHAAGNARLIVTAVNSHAAHAALLAAAKNAANYVKGGPGTRWQQAPILHALQAAIAAAEEPAP